MSYCAEVSFVSIKHAELENFMLKLKSEIEKNYLEIADADCVFSPFGSPAKTEKEHQYVMKMSFIWAEQVFTYRFFFLGKRKELVLAVVGVPDVCKHLFDTTIFFQDSTDQDYEYAIWDKVALFKRITEQYRARAARRKKPLEEYYIKSGCYDCVWRLLDAKVFDPGLDVRLFCRKSDFAWLSKFIGAVKERYQMKYGS